MTIDIINDWKPETRSLLASLKAQGCEIVKCSNDGGESFTKRADVTAGAFLEELLACDEAHLYVRTPTGILRCLYLVLGNSPGEIVCDYTVDPALDAAVDAHYVKWETRGQPKAFRASVTLVRGTARLHVGLTAATEAKVRAAVADYARKSGATIANP